VTLEVLICEYSCIELLRVIAMLVEIKIIAMESVLYIANEERHSPHGIRYFWEI
jgi:hypothetical protein